MKADPKFLEMVSKLSETEKERLLSRMTGKLPRRLQKDKIGVDEAIALQLEIEDEQLQDWRKQVSLLRDGAKKITEEKEKAAKKPKVEEKPKASAKAKGKSSKETVAKTKAPAKPTE